MLIHVRNANIGRYIGWSLLFRAGVINASFTCGFGTTGEFSHWRNGIYAPLWYRPGLWRVRVCVRACVCVCVCKRKRDTWPLTQKTHIYTVYIFELNRWACPLPWPPGRAPLYVFVGTASYVLLHEELVDSLLLPDELHDESVQVDKQSPAKTTGNAAHKHTHTEEVSPNRETERQRQSLTGLTFSQ